ncbi:MAG TPA: MaoC family dehydratase [Acidimicrobiales bacterium]|jgi:acyl dehydratase|nr:MaoC family dehydratase [Acidimicrobiales bacterium]
MIAIASLEDLTSHVGRHLGFSDYLEITQQRVDNFAEATGDRQWIHVDVARAAGGPFGGTIAHGYLTLSLGPLLLHDLLSWQNIRMGVNYGLNRVRFPSPVPVGSRVRLGAVLLEAEDLGGGGVQARVELTFELDGAPKPACVAELILRYYFDQ